MEYFTKSDVVTAALREMLITGELSPGTELRQRDLAVQFNVSPTPVREALRRLEAEGLIEYDVHRGARVIEAAIGADEENFLIRAALEGLAVALAAKRVTDDDVEALTSINDMLANCVEGDPRALELNRRLHFRLYNTAKSPLLMALLRMLWQSFPRGTGIARPLEESVRQHAEIIRLLSVRDAVGAEAAIHHHIMEARPDGFLKDAPPPMAMAALVS